VEDGAGNGQILDSWNYDVSLKTQLNISGAQTFTVVYKNDLNDKAAGQDNYNALRVSIYAVYNDAPDGTGADRTVKVTALIKDCQCCGAYLNAAHTQWLNFSCHNLGSDENADPFTPAAAIHGHKYKFGAQSATVPMSEDQDPAKTEAFDDWGSRYYQNDSQDWDKNADPCPAGWRLPTQTEWNNVISNNVRTPIGAWTSAYFDYTNFSAALKFGNALLLPGAGDRRSGNGKLYSRAAHGYYWSSNTCSSNAYTLYIYSGSEDTRCMERSNGYSVRCVAN
jgi:uncharacterized protein (TIGR02145 family)